MRGSARPAAGRHHVENERREEGATTRQSCLEFWSAENRAPNPRRRLRPEDWTGWRKKKDKVFVDKNCGVGRALTEKVLFIHASVLQGAVVLTIGTDAWGQSRERPRSFRGDYRARRAWRQNAWRRERGKEKANRVAQEVRRAAALTAELAAQSEKEISAVCDQPLGLRDELAEHIEAPNMEECGSRVQATIIHNLTCSASSRRQPVRHFSGGQSLFPELSSSRQRPLKPHRKTSNTSEESRRMRGNSSGSSQGTNRTRKRSSSKSSSGE